MAATAAATTHPSLMDRIATVLPILTWARTYNKAWLRPDLIAGLTVAAFAVPEDMAYASLAGLAPQHGLYASLVSLLVYAAVGTSRQLSYGVTSALSIMVAGSLGVMAFSDPNEYLAAAGFVALVSGAMGFVAWLFRLGFIANFVSESVLTGFSAGAALYIGSSQLAKLFGIEGVQGNFFVRVWNVLSNLGETNGWTLGLGLGCLAALLVLEERLPKLPGALLVVIVAIAILWTSDLEERGVEVAGSIPSGLPTPALPTVASGDIGPLVSLGFGVFLLSYVEGIGVAKTFAARYKEKIDPNQELFANGATNMAAGFMQGYSVGGSMSRSAVNDSAGAKTPAAGAFAAIILGVVLLFLTGPFSHLPETTLAAIVFVAVRRLIDVPAIRRLWRVSRGEFLAASATFMGVLLLGMLEGIIIGVLVSFLVLLKRVSMPHTSTLGLRPGTNDFVDTVRTPEAEVDPEVLVFRANAGWFYANAPLIKDDLMRDIDALETPPKLVVIDMATAPLVDLGAVETLGDIKEDLDDRGIDLRLAGVYGEVDTLITQAGVNQRLGEVVPNEGIDEALHRWRTERQPTAAQP